MPQVQLTDIIAPSFYDVWRAADDPAIHELWLKGGRGSCKSTFCATLILCGMLRDPHRNAIVYHKVADTIRETVYAQFAWAVNALGISRYVHFGKSPLEITFVQTGQRILFRGADNPEKSKGLKLQRGYFGYLWFEELTEFLGFEDIRTIKASVLRGTNQHALTLYSYNPPMSATSWVNAEALKPPEGRLTHHSDYRGVPRTWLGEGFIAEAEALQAMNERAYRHMYLGEVTGTGGQVFDNLKLRSIQPSEWQGLHCYNGLDFGFASDPDTFVRCAHDRKRRRLYIVAEFAATGLLIDTLGREVRKRCGREAVTCDSAEPRSIAALRAQGLPAIGAKKGADSVDHGTKWLQTLAEIVIDPRACPFAAREFSAYEYARDKAGNVLPGYPDKDNHTIDAARYAMESVSTMRTAIVPK